MQDKKIKQTKPTTIIKWLFIFLFFLFLTNPMLIPFISQDTKESLMKMWNDIIGDVGAVPFDFNLMTGIRVAIIILLMITLTKIADFIIEKIKPKTGKGRSSLSLIRSAINYLSVIITIFWCLSAMGVNVGTLAAGVGIIALAVSFGAQALIEDVVTGIFLVFEDEFDVGDIIEVDGFRGTVVSIGIRVTTVKDVGNNYKIINNSNIRNVLNRSSAISTAVTTVSVSYNEDIEHVENVLKELFPKIKEAHSDIFVKTPEYLGIESLGDHGMTLKIIGQVREKDIYNAPRILNREIKIAFDKAGIEIPYPQLVVHGEND